MSAGAIPAPEVAPWARPARRAVRLGTPSYALIGLLGFVLPVMHYLAFGGSRVNACAADLLLLPVLFLLRERWMRGSGLAAWLLGLWIINLLAWSFSASLLTVNVFLREFIKVATCYLYALVGFGIGWEGRSERACVRGLVFSAIPMAAIGIFAFFTRVPAFFIIESRIVGTLTDANAFGIYLGMVLPLAASLYLTWLAIPLFIGAGVVSFSRTGLTAIGASLLLSMLHLGLRRYLLVAAVCVLVFIGVWRVASQTTVGKRVADYQGTFEHRQSLWTVAAEVAAEHPVLGVGKGNWEAASGRHTLPHNTFLSIMVDGGLLGFAVFAVPLAMWLWRGMKRGDTRPWAIAVFIGLVGGLAVSLDNFRPFWLAVGVLAARLTASRGRVAPAVSARPGLHLPGDPHWSQITPVDRRHGHPVG